MIYFYTGLNKPFPLLCDPHYIKCLLSNGSGCNPLTFNNVDWEINHNNFDKPMSRDPSAVPELQIAAAFYLVLPRKSNWRYALNCLDWGPFGGQECPRFFFVWLTILSAVCRTASYTWRTYGSEPPSSQCVQTWPADHSGQLRDLSNKNNGLVTCLWKALDLSTTVVLHFAWDSAAGLLTTSRRLTVTWHLSLKLILFGWQQDLADVPGVSVPWDRNLTLIPNGLSQRLSGLFTARIVAFTLFLLLLLSLLWKHRNLLRQWRVHFILFSHITDKQTTRRNEELNKETLKDRKDRHRQHQIHQRYHTTTETSKTQTS